MTRETFVFKKARTLVLARLLFCVVLFGATLILTYTGGPLPAATSKAHLFWLIGGVFLLSLLYALILRYRGDSTGFAFSQAMVDTFIVSIILLFTGAAESIFSFLYLVVISYASMLLYRKGSLIMAGLCVWQYGVIVLADVGGWLSPPFTSGLASHRLVDWGYALYKIVFTGAACLSVAWLSSLLAEQNRRNRLRITQMEEQVRRVEKMVMLGEMAAGMAHEIKNPLASLAGAVQMLQIDVPLREDQRRLMGIVLRETDRLNDLLNNFLLFSRPRAGKIERIRIANAVEETREMLLTNNRFKANLTLEQEIPRSLFVEMDPSHLRQILWNLLLNAADSRADGCRILVRAVAERDGMVRIDVADNGHGISDTDLTTIFDPFFTTKPHGTGLGLSIVHRLVHAGGGHIEVASTPGEGTVFTLFLPTAPPLEKSP